MRHTSPKECYPLENCAQGKQEAVGSAADLSLCMHESQEQGGLPVT